ncbi:hypothetical protein C8J57DRAFT_1244918 [Mycena rebaudengoi]|nr:hypothetical protein C8J57DRAFT_1244918 [Mycena rebaudengoi]
MKTAGGMRKCAARRHWKKNALQSATPPKARAHWLSVPASAEDPAEKENVRSGTAPIPGHKCARFPSACKGIENMHKKKRRGWDVKLREERRGEKSSAKRKYALRYSALSGYICMMAVMSGPAGQMPPWSSLSLMSRD